VAVHIFHHLNLYPTITGERLYDSQRPEFMIFVPNERGREPAQTRQSFQMETLLCQDGDDDQFKSRLFEGED
jgi:hypothetical protein